jgi:GTP-binding protein HflX
LVKAFRATLEEVNEAALVLHVVDASSPAAVEHTGHVLKVLNEIGAGAVPQVLVLNKVDRLAPGDSDAGALLRRLTGDVAGVTRAVSISALTGEGIPDLLTVMDEVLPVDPVVRTTLEVEAGDGATLAMLHEFGRVLSTQYEGTRALVDVELPESIARRFAAR